MSDRPFSSDRLSVEGINDVRSRGLSRRRLLGGVGLTAGGLMLGGRLMTPRAGAAQAATPGAVAPVTGWPTLQGDPGRTGASPDPGPVGQPALRWRVNTGLSQLNAAATIAGDVAYVATGLLGQGELVAIDVVSGREHWRRPLPEQPFASTPAVADGVIFVAGLQGSVVALEIASGAELWRIQLGASTTCSPAVVDGMVFIGANDDRYTALDAATGAERWSVGLGDGGDYTIAPSPAVAGGVVYVTTLSEDEDESLLALDIGSGEELWNFEPENPGLATPAVAGGVVYVGGVGGDVYALDAANGDERWWTGVGRVLSAPAVAGDAVFVHADGVLVGLDAAVGTERWRVEVGGVWSSPVVANGVVYVGGDGLRFEQGLFAVEAVSGTLIWRLDAVGSVMAAAAIAGDAVLIGDGDGGLVAITGTDATGPGSGATSTGGYTAPIVFSSQVDESGLALDPGVSFPASTTELHAGFDFIGMEDGAAVHATWLIDGAIVVERDAPWALGKMGHASERISANAGALPPGTYEIVVTIAGEEIRRGTATVGGS